MMTFNIFFPFLVSPSLAFDTQVSLESALSTREETRVSCKQKRSSMKAWEGAELRVWRGLVVWKWHLGKLRENLADGEFHWNYRNKSFTVNGYGREAKDFLSSSIHFSFRVSFFAEWNAKTSSHFHIIILFAVLVCRLAHTRSRYL